MLCVVFPLDHKYDVPAVAVNFTESPGQITCAVAGDIAALNVKVYDHRIALIATTSSICYTHCVSAGQGGID